VTAREELAGYVTLQRLLDEKTALKREIETPPVELVALRAALATRQQVLPAKRGRRTALALEQENLQAQIDALREEREHFRKQKSMVTNMKQLSAVVSELDHADGELKAREDRYLEVLQELESLDHEIADLGEETPNEREQREQIEAEWKTRQEATSERLQAVDRRIREVRRALGEASFERFRKLWNSRKPNAVVPIDHSACSACHAELRPSLVQLVRTVETLQHCDSCRRLLFDPEQFTG
jgi:predicted  nucleic acid-binding Zn-ribbon protein